jgi:hypothetical protein
VSSQPSIELPVIVKRPSGVNSLLDALLDPELSALSQTSNAAAAAAAAAVSGKVLASEASSSGVGGHSTAAGYKPPNQLRKGYSWHGNSWFAAAAGSTGGGKQGSSSSSSQAWPGVQQPGGQYVNPPQLAAVEASVLDLDPLLPERSGDVPGSVLSSCDPLQVGGAPSQSHVSCCALSCWLRPDSQFSHESCIIAVDLAQDLAALLFLLDLSASIVSLCCPAGLAGGAQLEHRRGALSKP